MRAAQIKRGDKVTYCGHTFVASAVEPGPSGLVRVDVAGEIPQYIAADREVDIERIPVTVEKPYYAYTRDYDADGNCDKRVFRFRTRKQQSSFLRRTNRCVTNFN